MTSYISAFNNLILKFNQELIETFPEENEFKVYKRSLEWLMKSNVKKVCNLFKVYTINFREKIVQKDESFFLENNNYSQVVDTQDEGIVLIINKLKKYWGTLSDSNKENIWGYMNTLIKLGDLVQ